MLFDFVAGLFLGLFEPEIAGKDSFDNAMVVLAKYKIDGGYNIKRAIQDGVNPDVLRAAGFVADSTKAFGIVDIVNYSFNKTGVEHIYCLKCLPCDGVSMSELRNGGYLKDSNQPCELCGE